MSDLKWRYCPRCEVWRKAVDFCCPVCGGRMTAGRSRREPQLVDPRAQKPVANRETKPI